MARRIGRSWCLFLLTAACSGSSSGPELLEGFEPPPPADGEVQLLIPIVRGIAPGADVTLCTYLDFEVDQDLDVIDYAGFQSAFGHHAILYGVAQRQEANTHECTDEDMLNARYLGGGGADSPPQYLPEGIVLRMKQGAQLMIQTHWINTSDAAIDGQAAFNVTLVPAQADAVVADLFTTVTTDIEVPPGTGAARATCTVPRDLNVFLYGGHAHEWGTRLTITRTPEVGEPELIYDTPWGPEYQFNPPREAFTRDAPFVFHAGDRITVDCEYENDLASPLRFPTEMCVMWAYYFPAEKQLDCVDGFWPEE